MVVFRFLEWIESAPAPARIDAVAPLVRTALRPDLDPTERDALEAAMTILLDDPDVDVRSALAEALAREEDVPRHLVVALANDLPLVAEPLFQRSPLLLDEELVEAIDGGSARIQLAIAQRPWVSFRVSAALVTHGTPEAVIALLENPGSDVDISTYARAAGRFGEDHDVREALFRRPDLPIAVRQTLIAGLGAKLGALMIDRAWTSEKRAATVVREACDRATVALAADAGEDDIGPLVEHLRASGQLTTALLIRSVCQGHMAFLEAALVSLSALPAAKVYPILAGGREAAMRALFQRAGLPERSHSAFVAAIEAWRDLDAEAFGDRARYQQRMVERVLARSGRFAGEEMEDLIALLRRLAAEAAREAARTFVGEARAAARVPRIEAQPSDDVSAAA